MPLQNPGRHLARHGDARLQVFPDLFSREILRPGEQIEVGTLTVLFTDLQDSTRLYCFGWTIGGDFGRPGTGLA
jgi:hypothetical protein